MSSIIEFDRVNKWEIRDGRDFAVIDHLEGFDPFFLSIATVTNQWLFCSSNGSLSAGRENLTKEAQILCFQCGANSIFYGDELLTTSNPSFQDDRKLLKDVGVLFNKDFEYCDKTVSSV